MKVTYLYARNNRSTNTVTSCTTFLDLGIIRFITATWILMVLVSLDNGYFISSVNGFASSSVSPLATPMVRRHSNTDRGNLKWDVVQLHRRPQLCMTSASNNSLDGKDINHDMTDDSSASLSKLTALSASASVAIPQSSSSKNYSFLYKLNASTKWLITMTQTIAVWSRPLNYQGPFIVVGSILSVYITDVLKRVINQQRPTDAPSLINDPGMPSSHSLVAFFLCTAWITATTTVSTATYSAPLMMSAQLAILGAAFGVASLRVICGYHTYAQVGVGAILGSIFGYCWSQFGMIANQSNPRLTYVASFGAYILGSVVFMWSNMRSWITKEGKHL